MAVPKDFLWDAIEQLTTEVERLDPNSLVAARHRGFLMARDMSPMTGDRHDRSRSAIEDDQVAAAYLAGKSIEAISIETGHAKDTVRRALVRRGVEVRRPGEAQEITYALRDEERIDRIRQFHAEGKSAAEIARLEGVTRERIRQIGVRAGIDLSHRLPTADELTAVAEYASNGGSLIEIAERHNMSLHRMKGLVARAGHEIRKERRRHPRTLQRAKLAASLYRAGKLTAEIAKKIGVQQPTIYRLLAIAGVGPDRGAFNSKQEAA